MQSLNCVIDEKTERHVVELHFNNHENVKMILPENCDEEYRKD